MPECAHAVPAGVPPLAKAGTRGKRRAEPGTALPGGAENCAVGDRPTAERRRKKYGRRAGAARAPAGHGKERDARRGQRRAVDGGGELPAESERSAGFPISPGLAGTAANPFAAADACQSRSAGTKHARVRPVLPATRKATSCGGGGLSAMRAPPARQAASPASDGPPRSRRAGSRRVTMAPHWRFWGGDMPHAPDAWPRSAGAVQFSSAGLPGPSMQAATTTNRRTSGENAAKNSIRRRIELNIPKHSRLGHPAQGADNGR